jgi:hypothetical protein
MDNRQTATYLARSRVGMGIALLIAPRLGLRLTLGPIADARITAPLGRIAGIRDVVLGAGGSISLGERRGGANWLSMGAVADGVDALVLLATPGLAKRARLVGIAAAASAVAHMYFAKEIAGAEHPPV